MKTNLKHSKFVNSQGFSLVEMLVVIAVIGILAAVAVPMVASATTLAAGSRDQRNAQTLASLANNAIASGDLTIPAAESTDEVVDMLLRGVSGSGVLEGMVFQLHNLGEEERVGALALLSWNGGVLSYHPAG